MAMKEFMRAHQESLLVVLTVALLAIIVACVIWVVAVLTTNLTRAITVNKTVSTSPAFHLDGARKLNLRVSQ